MLHNSLPIKKKVHMQNISHVPIRIDWLVYDISEDITENPKLIELIPVIDNNPFDNIKSEATIIDDNNDDIMSQTTISTSKTKIILIELKICYYYYLETSSRIHSTISARSTVSSNDDRPAPLIKLYVKPYRGKRASETHPIYAVTSTTKVNKMI